MSTVTVNRFRQMVETTQQLVRVFAALGDPTRLATIARLAHGPASVGELAQPFDLTSAGFSKHLRVLMTAGLVTKELDGRRHRCSLHSAPLQAAYEWLAIYEKFWSDSLDGLETFLKETKDDDSE